MIKSLSRAVFGTRNDRLLKAYKKRVREVNVLEEEIAALDDEALKERFAALRAYVAGEQFLQNGEFSEKTHDLEKLADEAHKRGLERQAEAFAIIREASRRVLGMRHFDVQLIGGMVLYDGAIAEMKTGEGKTLVATLAVALAACAGKSVHVVTTNDYLAARDGEQMGALYEFLGFSVGVITANVPQHERQSVYASDIVYGTNSEFGFDYLRDNMALEAADKCQRAHYFAIVDEVDSILIDEARTPLIISGPAGRNLEGYIKANEVARQMVRGEQPADPKEPATGDFVADEKNRNILITEAGIDKAEKLFGVDNLYSIENAPLAHQLDQALKANNLFEKDVHYVVQNGEVLIVDEFTGRISEGRRFSEGLHQALEAKEGLRVQEESQTLADITYQNYFRMYEHLSGMTGTAQTEATEFSQIYKLEVISIPTNLPVARKDLNDLIYKTQDEKFKAVVAEIKRANEHGQPVLVGTASIEKSEILHEYLKKAKIAHNVLNAKNHAQEAEIIKDAGKKGAVTIATNMAGRGVDIKITDEIKELGGLYIIGTERHESRRIDNQLRGRSGRQGDPGVSRFYLSLEDNLLRIFGGDKLKAIFTRLKIDEGESIESSLVTRAVASAQKKVESLHFESRKHVLEYDDVANEQRKVIYRYRNELLDENFALDGKIHDNLLTYANALVAEYEQLQAEREGQFLHNGEFSEKSAVLGKLGDAAGAGGGEARLREFIRQRTGLDTNASEPADIAEGLAAMIEAKFSIAPAEEAARIKRLVYLQVLDTAWREHLYTMDILKAGIGLRGYNQKDPLVEYKKESFFLFNELVERIQSESVRYLLLLQLRTADESAEAAEAAGGTAAGAAASGKKPARNDDCPCGSGEKYKNCCGKSGPKKGIFA